jgi:acetyl-CoA acyltransferase
MTDGASAMLVADRHVAERLGLPIRARLVHFAVAAEDATLVLSAPVPVTHKLLERSGMSVDDFDAIECNEAFAADRSHVVPGLPPGPRPLQPARGARSPSGTLSGRPASGS